MAILGIAMPAALSAQGAQQAGSPQAAAPKVTATSGQAHPSAKHRKKQDPEAEVVQPPPAPPTPEQLPPVAPEITYQAGQLTIRSQNATLAQVLRTVQSKTGASFDIPASANNERVVAQLGPGRPSDVLATLLNGSKFDFIILGVPNQPGTVQKLILTTRTTAPANSTTTQARANTPQPQDEPPLEEDYSQPEPPPSQEDSAGNQNQVPPGGYRPGVMIPGQPNQNPEFPGQQPGNNPDAQAPGTGVKTPEQLLQELQRMQQQQQQYQQQLNPANQNLPPPNNLPQEQQ